MIGYSNESYTVYNSTPELESRLRDEDAKATCNILLVGNGFDLALKKDTSFKSFIAFLVLFLVIGSIKNYPKKYPTDLYAILKEESISHEKYGYLVSCIIKSLEDNEEKSDEQLKKIQQKIEDLFKNDFFSLIIKSIIPAVEYFLPYNFDYLKTNISLKRIRNIYGESFFYNNFSSQELEKDKNKLKEKEYYGRLSRNDENVNFNGYLDKLYALLQIDFLNHWFDVESIIELVATKDDYLLNKYKSPANEKVFESIELKTDYVKTQKYLDGLNLFESLFSFYLLIIKKYDSKKNGLPKISELYLESAKEMSFGKITSLDFNDIDLVVNYNYTDYASSSLETNTPNPKQFPEFFYVNGHLSDTDFFRIKEYNNIVIGYTSTKNNHISNIDLFCFEKKHRRILKNVKAFDINSLLSEKKKKTYNLLIFGHSCCLADRDILVKLFTSNKLKECVICCYSRKEFRNIYLRVYSMIHSLYSEKTDQFFSKIHFAVKKENSE